MSKWWLSRAALLVSLLLLVLVPATALGEDYMPLHTDSANVLSDQFMFDNVPIVKNKVLVPMAPNMAGLYGAAIQASNRAAVATVTQVVVGGAKWLAKTIAGASVGGCVWNYDVCRSKVESWFGQ